MMMMVLIASLALLEVSYHAFLFYMHWTCSLSSLISCLWLPC